MEFFVPGLPTTKNRRRAIVVGGQARVVPDAKGQQKQRAFAAVAAEHAPTIPCDRPMRLALEFTFPVPKSWPKWKRAAALEGRWHHTSRPDLSRLVTFAEDALSAVFFVDDSQVREIVASKVYGERPGTWVALRPLEQAVRT